MLLLSLPLGLLGGCKSIRELRFFCGGSARASLAPSPDPCKDRMIPPASGDHHHKDSTEGRAPRARPRQPRLKGLGSQAQRTAQESCDCPKTAQDPSQRIAMCPGDAPSGFVSPQLPGGEVGPAIGSSVPPCSAGYCLLEGRGVMQV